MRPPQVPTPPPGRHRVKHAATTKKSASGPAQSPVAGGEEVGRAARNSAMFGVGIAASSLLQFGFVLLVTHTASQTSAGALFEAIAIFTILSNVVLLGANSGLLRFMPIVRARTPGDARRLIRVAVVPVGIASVVAAIVTLILTEPIARLVAQHKGVEHLLPSLRVLAIMLPAGALILLHTAALRAWNPRVPVFINYLFVPTARWAIYIVCALIGLTIAGALAWGVPLLVGSVLAARAASRTAHSSEPPSSKSTRELARDFWTYSAPRSLAAIFQVIVTWLDVLLVGHFLSAALAAAYSSISRYLLVLQTFGQGSISSAITPQLSRLIDAEKTGEAKAVYKTATMWITILTWPAFLVLACGSNLFARTFGHGYGVASGALCILALAMLVNMATGPNDVLLLMSGRSKLSLAIQAVGVTVNVGLNITLIPRLGLSGAAWAWAATIVSVSLITSVVLWRQTSIQPLQANFATAAGAAVVLVGAPALIGRLVFGGAAVPFLAFAALGYAAYGLMLYRFRSHFSLQHFAPFSARRAKSA